MSLPDDDWPTFPLTAGFRLPACDVGAVLETIGIKLFARERTIPQYVDWAYRTGLFEVLRGPGGAGIGEVIAATPLSEAGADALLGMLCALGLVKRSTEARFTLSPAARDYLLADSPFFLGHQIKAKGLPMPWPYLRARPSVFSRAKLQLMRFHPGIRYGSVTRLHNQHARNLGPCAAAVRTGEFRNTTCMVDVAGGSGTFSIPFALDHPGKRVILTDVASAIRQVAPVIRAHGLQDRIETRTLDAFEFPWRIPPCDGVFIGSFLHGFDDDQCSRLCRAGLDGLVPGGRLWVHEMLWNDTRDGPLITALWHAAMRSAGPGRQRTAAEISLILRDAGFEDIRVTPTTGAFAMVSGRRPPANDVPP